MFEPAIWTRVSSDRIRAVRWVEQWFLVVFAFAVLLALVALAASRW